MLSLDKMGVSPEDWSQKTFPTKPDRQRYTQQYFNEHGENGQFIRRSVAKKHLKVLHPGQKFTNEQLGKHIILKGKQLDDHLEQ